MLSVLTLMWRILFSPAWLLWKLYGGLWWAFDDSDARPKTPVLAAPLDMSETRAQNAAFEVVDSRPPAPAAMPRPTGPLMGGFVGSLSSSAMFFWLSRMGVDGDVISNDKALMMWGWASVMVFVGSLWVVRHVARRQEAEKPKTVFGKVKAAAGGMKDAAWSAGAWAAAAPAKVKAAAVSVKHGAEKVGASAHRAAGSVRGGSTRVRFDRIRHGAETATRRLVGAMRVLAGRANAKGPVTDQV